jgi:hypothetical protein
MVLGERSLLPSEGLAPGEGKPSVVLGRLTWKWWSKDYWRCLVEAIKRIDQEKQASNTQKRAINSSFMWYSLMQALIDDEEASQPQQDDSALDL